MPPKSCLSARKGNSSRRVAWAPPQVRVFHEDLKWDLPPLTSLAVASQTDNSMAFSWSKIPPSEADFQVFTAPGRLSSSINPLAFACQLKPLRDAGYHVFTDSESST